MSLFESHQEMLAEVETTLRMECEDAGHLKEPMLEAFIGRAGALLAEMTSPGEALERMGHIAGRLLPKPKIDEGAGPESLFQQGEALLAAVAAQHGLSVEDLKGVGRSRRIGLARCEALWTLCEARQADGRRRFSLLQIGRMVGGRDHTTVLQGARRWMRLLAAREAAS